MGQFLLVLVVAIVAAAIVFGVVTMISDGDAGLGHAEPDGRAVPLPGARPLAEPDIAALRFDTTIRGYRMEQVDQALRRTAYDIGYKDELITVLEAEVEALRAGRQEEADELRAARKMASPTGGAPATLTDDAYAPEADASDTDDAYAAESDESDTDLPVATAGAETAAGDAAAPQAEPGDAATAQAEPEDEDPAVDQAEDLAEDHPAGDDPAGESHASGEEAAVAGSYRAGAEHGR